MVVWSAFARPSFFAVFLAVAALSCSTATTYTPAATGDATAGDAASPDAGSPEIASYSAYLSAFVTADCDRQIRCTPSKYATVDACVAAIPAATTLQRQHIGESIAAGKTAYFPAKAQSCLDTVRKPCSTTYLDELKACNAVIDGKVALGQSCIGHFECLDTTPKDPGPYCFGGCKGLFGDQDPAPTGTCVADSPIGTAACP